MRACGGELSAGKHIRTSHKGVYLESLWCCDSESSVHYTTLRHEWVQISRRRKRLEVVRERLAFPKSVEPRREMVIPLKGFFDSGLAHPTRKLPAAMPDWVVAGESAEALREQGFPSHLIHDLTLIAFPRAIKQLRSHRIPPYLPRFLGGGGLVPRGGDDTRLGRLASRGYRKAVASLLSDSSDDRDPQILGRIWVNTKMRYATMVTQEVSGFLKTIRHHLGEFPPDGEEDWFDCGTDFLEQATARGNRRHNLMFPLIPQEVRLGQVARQLSSRISVLSERWQSSKPWNKTLSATREIYSTLVEKARVWLPRTEDPTRPGVYGTPFWADPQATDQLRRLVIDAMALPL
jgi:hypothetical protein